MSDERFYHSAYMYNTRFRVKKRRSTKCYFFFFRFVLRNTSNTNFLIGSFIWLISGLSPFGILSKMLGFQS